jgi:D-3-phosphoglycerate dehydrogenase
MKVFTTHELPQECRKMLGEELTQDPSDIINAEVIMGWPTELSNLVSRAPKVKALQTFSAGVESMDFSVLPKSVKVFSNAGAYSLPVAEHAWALILSLAKKVGKRARGESYLISGKTLLVLGAGGIGSKVARIGRDGFSMKTIGISRSFKDPEAFHERYSYREVENHLGRADVVVNALPLTKETRNFLNWERLSKLKDRSIIVNVGRGETVDREAMIKLLRERPSIRFGTDVFWRKDGKENFDDPIWELDNFTGTPHTAGADATREALDAAMVAACTNVARFLREGKADNEVRIEDYI